MAEILWLIALAAANVWNPFGLVFNQHSSDPLVRMEQLLNESEDLRQLHDEWRRFWLNDQSPQPWMAENLSERIDSKNDHRMPILPPLKPGEKPTCELPERAEIMRALPRFNRGIPYIYEEFRDDIEFTVEKLVDRVDPPRFFPLLGLAQFHHCHWKCTVYYTETIPLVYPFSSTLKRRRAEVVYIDKDHLHPCVSGFDSQAETFRQMTATRDQCVSKKAEKSDKLSSDAIVRIEQLMLDSETLRRFHDEYRRFWMNDQPSHRAPCHDYGAVGAVDTRIGGVCAAPQKAEHRVLACWDARVHVCADLAHPGTKLAALKGSVYLFATESGKTIDATGSIHVELCDPQLRKLAAWTLDAASLENLKRKDLIGTGYTLVLPLDAPSIAAKDVKLYVTYHPERGKSCFDGPTLLTLQAERTPIVPARPVGRSVTPPDEARYEVSKQMTLSQVIALSRRDIAADIIIRQMEATGSVFDLTVDDILHLHDEGVSNGVIRAMQERRTPPPAEESLRPSSPYQIPGGAGPWSKKR